MAINDDGTPNQARVASVTGVRQSGSALYVALFSNEEVSL